MKRHGFLQMWRNGWDTILEIIHSYPILIKEKEKRKIHNFLVIMYLIAFIVLNRLLSTIWYRKKCNICYRRFFSFDASARPYLLIDRRRWACPFCGAKDRHRLLIEVIKEKISNNARILHIAPTHLSKAFASMNAYETADKNRKDVDHSIDLCSLLPKTLNCFDWIIWESVLEYVDDFIFAINNLLCKLNPEGSILFYEYISQGTYTKKLSCEVNASYNDFKPRWIFGSDFDLALRKKINERYLITIVDGSIFLGQRKAKILGVDGTVIYYIRDSKL